MSSVTKLLDTMNGNEAKEAAGRSPASALVVDPLTSVEDAIKKMEETRSMIADLDDGTPQLARAVLDVCASCSQQSVREGGQGGV